MVLDARKPIEVDRRSLLLLAAGTLVSGCAALGYRPGDASLVASAPAIPREFRAAWVATVANIDWPSRRALTTAEQQAEIRSTVQLAAELGLNALILQVRTSADALYASTLEPWSEYLTGAQGQAPEPLYDPLASWIAQAHAQGLELHAWLNPYRARQGNAQGVPHASHVSQRRPSWVKTYGKQLWIDPGEPEAAAHTVAVCRDVLNRYPVDALHIDDYFYPYPEKNTEGTALDFPDEPSWLRYVDEGGTLARADWRRQNVDQLVQALFELTRQVRPGARFGISPFGLMKPADRPPGIVGFSQFDELFADVERWMREGWLDYLMPQLYWARDSSGQAFGPLLQAWTALNPRARHLWPGLFTSRINNEATSWLPDEVVGQIELARSLNPGGGHAHFSMVALARNRKGIADQLKAQSYSTPALPPATPWAGQQTPPVLALQRVAAPGGAMRLRAFSEGDGESGLQRAWAWWRVVNGDWRGQLLGTAPFDWAPDADALVISPISLTGLEGQRQAWIA